MKQIKRTIDSARREAPRSQPSIYERKDRNKYDLGLINTQQKKERDYSSAIFLNDGL